MRRLHSIFTLATLCSERQSARTARMTTAQPGLAQDAL